MSLRDKGLGARGKVGTGGSESAIQGIFEKRVCRGWDGRRRRTNQEEPIKRNQHRGTKRKDEDMRKA